MKVIVCKNMNKPDDGIASAVVGKLREFGIEAEFSDNVHAGCDLVITAGGDGTILHHGKNAAKLGLPLLGINTGRLGFMTTLETDELNKLEALREIIPRLKGDASAADSAVCPRMMLDIELEGQTFTALNDAVFYKDINSKLPDFKVLINGTVISELRADGLILSTPTGSTAYALSAGGPIIEPWIDLIELTPLAAHSLFNRPMILSADNPIEVRYDTRSEASGNYAVFLSVDGEKGIEFKRGESAVIRKSQLKLSLIDLNNNSFYNAVTNKLMKPLK
jgi:NAD+ kinase